jgi:hypothetical protein
MCHGWDGKYTMKMTVGAKRIYEIPDELSSSLRAFALRLGRPAPATTRRALRGTLRPGSDTGAKDHAAAL